MWAGRAGALRMRGAALRGPGGGGEDGGGGSECGEAVSGTFAPGPLPPPRAGPNGTARTFPRRARRAARESPLRSRGGRDGTGDCEREREREAGGGAALSETGLFF